MSLWVGRSDGRCTPTPVTQSPGSLDAARSTAQSWTAANHFCPTSAGMPPGPRMLWVWPSAEAKTPLRGMCHRSSWSEGKNRPAEGSSSSSHSLPLGDQHESSGDCGGGGRGTLAAGRPAFRLRSHLNGFHSAARAQQASAPSASSVLSSLPAEPSPPMVALQTQ